MSNSGDQNASPQGSQNPAPRRPSQVRRPRISGEGPSDSSSPPQVPRQGGAQFLRPRLFGVTSSRPTFGGLDSGSGGGFDVGGGSGSGSGSGSGGGVVVGAAGLQIGGAGGIAQRKRFSDPGAGPSRPVGDNPPPPPPPPPHAVAGGAPYVCYLCGRGFRTDRGLCGHLRTHGNRQWRGAYPPPTFSRDEFYEAGVGYLLNPPLQPHDGADLEEEEDVEEEGGNHAAAAVVEDEEERREVVDPTGDQPAAGENEAAPLQREPLDLNKKSEEAMAAEADSPGLNLNESPRRDDQGNYI
ncbi:unnamed protein product [Camellia sinensis]